MSSQHWQGDSVKKVLFKETDTEVDNKPPEQSTSKYDLSIFEDDEDPLIADPEEFSENEFKPYESEEENFPLTIKENEIVNKTPKEYTLQHNNSDSSDSNSRESTADSFFTVVVKKNKENENYPYMVYLESMQTIHKSEYRSIYLVQGEDLDSVASTKSLDDHECITSALTGVPLGGAFWGKKSNDFILSTNVTSIKKGFPQRIVKRKSKVTDPSIYLPCPNCKGLYRRTPTYKRVKQNSQNVIYETVKEDVSESDVLKRVLSKLSHDKVETVCRQDDSKTQCESDRESPQLDAHQECQRANISGNVDLKHTYKGNQTKPNSPRVIFTRMNPATKSGIRERTPKKTVLGERQKKSKIKEKTPKKTAMRVKQMWSSREKQLVREYFSEHLAVGQLPKFTEIKEFIKKLGSKLKPHRTTMKIYAWIQAERCRQANY